MRFQSIVCVGGEDDKVVLRSVESWDPALDLWKQLACLPFAVSKHGLVVSGLNHMYMAGGEYPDGSASKAVWRYDPRINVWQEMAPMLTPRSELGKLGESGCEFQPVFCFDILHLFRSRFVHGRLQQQLKVLD